MNTKEFFFTISLTENEHYIVEHMMQEFCKDNECKLVYYRKFKNGHVPMEREVKVRGKNIGKFKKFLEDNMIKVGNYHRD